MASIRHLLIAVCALIMLFPTSLQGERPVKPEPPKRTILPPSVDEESLTASLVGRADTAIAEQRWQDAAILLSDALNSAPDDAARVMVLSNLALTYGSMGRDSLAVATIDRALGIAPNMVTLLYNRARLHLMAGRDGDAYDDLSRVVSLDSVNLEGRYYHGMMSLYAGMPEVAKADFDMLQSVAPSSHGTALAWANYYSLTRDDLKAIPYYKRVLERDTSAEYYAALAGCYLATDNLTEASATLADALRQYPDDPELYYYRAWLNRERLLLDDAHADARRAIALGADARRVNQLFTDK